MATLAPGGRITPAEVDAEIERLRVNWGHSENASTHPHLATCLSSERVDSLDLFDRVQLDEVVRVCRATPSLAAAGRVLFSASRARKSSSNDSDRLRKYLARFDLDWDAVRA